MTTASQRKDQYLSKLMYGYLGKRTITWLAQATGLKRQALSYKLEDPSRMRIDELRAVCNVLKIPPESVSRGF